MMLKPSIDKLLDRVNSKYSLVILASKRAHELDAGAKPTVESFDSVKSVGQALEEIEAETVINQKSNVLGSRWKRKKRKPNKNGIKKKWKRKSATNIRFKK